ncbi:protein gp37 [Cohaesibacter sp. ES.047]|uniref:DUF5131 family protein n=1 Tax=Cohaesibacter sp. ES.047 TaxID=1798205 RepID=UPI000BB857C9|nr:phage Gp37/Gp68 family protein [Cohaesibacter sp. ES.047]SNY94088.1 protein gp37 [Cohaesibacter sp. ES.047]
MAENSKIEWTEATWNPIAGCSVASPGCKNCYAMTSVAPRLAANPKTPHYHGTVEKTAKGKYVWTGKIGVAGEDKLMQPLRWKKPRMIFVNSTSDLFHPNVPENVIDRIFAVMALCPQHTFQVLTKHPERMRDYSLRKNPNGHHPAMDYAALMAATGSWNTPAVDLFCWPLPNVWLGVSIEDQPRADERIPHLLGTPAAKRFVSCEPLLGPVDLSELTRLDGTHVYSCLPPVDVNQQDDEWNGATVDWVICGGESGAGARPMHPDWARSIRDQCVAADVPFFMKQMGGKRKPFEPIPDDLMIREFPNAPR